MLSVIRTAGVIGALAVVAAAGCGSVNTATDAGDDDDVVDGGSADADMSPDAMPPDPCSGDVAYDDFWDCLQADACELLQRCVAAFVDDADCLDANLFLFGDVPGQVGRFLYADSISRGAINYDPGAAGACLDLLSGFECAALFSGSQDPVEECTVFTGVRNDGQGCFHDDECAIDGSRCVVPGGGGCGELACCAGNCVAPVPLEGDCSSNRNCAPGAYCVNVSANGAWICKSGESGAVCNNAFDCDPDFFCNSGQCAADFATNSTCTDEAQCPVGEVCVGNDLQNGNGQGTCGRVDRNNDPCDGDCSFTMWCNQPDATMLGACRPLPGLGGSCSVSGRCVSFFQLECDAGTSICVVSGTGVGTGCTGSNGCEWPLFCNNEVTGAVTGICTAQQASGASCTYAEHCSSQICAGNPPAATCQDFTGCL